ncbi:MAG: methyltransferase domain-containing protein [Nanoarchaeota archaeon]|nr:methyltransferase domain-containing protein [Nanoarchaeota archaeon]
MKYIFLLSGENEELAKEEVLAVTKAKDYELDGRILLANCKKFNFERLAYTHKVLRFIFAIAKDKLISKIDSVNWQKHYKNNFCVRAKGKFLEEKVLAGHIWTALKNPKVKLEKSSTQIEFIENKNKIYCGLLVSEVPKEYWKRQPHLRPGFHPSSINAKLARACVNLSGIKQGQTLYDPFCGTGGILIEAGLIGCRIIGSDIDQKMIKRTKINLKNYNINNFKLSQTDAAKAKQEFDTIVTDPPYGKASSLHKKNNIELYETFLANASKLLKKNKRLVFILPSKIKVKTSLTLLKMIDVYVHSSLTRRIYIFTKY